MSLEAIFFVPAGATAQRCLVQGENGVCEPFESSTTSPRISNLNIVPMLQRGNGVCEGICAQYYFASDNKFQFQRNIVAMLQYGNVSHFRKTQNLFFHKSREYFLSVLI